MKTLGNGHLSFARKPSEGRRKKGERRKDKAERSREAELSTFNFQLSTTSIAVVGLGYVGLPLSLQFARSGVSVLGLDIDPAKVDSLNRGRSYIKHTKSTTIPNFVNAKNFQTPPTSSP